jgi:hypothetical protein
MTLGLGGFVSLVGVCELVDGFGQALGHEDMVSSFAEVPLHESATSDGHPFDARADARYESKIGAPAVRLALIR